MFVYTREAHAADSAKPTLINLVEDPITLDERRTVALDFVKDSKLDFPTLVDSMDDKASNGYASLPDRLYLVGKDGKIAWAGEKGPHGFDPKLLEKEIIAHKGK